MKHYNNKSDKIHGEYIYNGSGIVPKTEKNVNDSDSSVVLALKSVPYNHGKVNDSALERWK